MADTSTKLVIVESPTKAKTIRQYLGKEYRVEASMGHVRDLPSNASEIPSALKGKTWARIGVNLEEGFAPIYVVPSDKKKVVAELKKALAQATELYVATDEDREGESIGWHLVEVLKPKIPTKRMVFHEITPEAIQRALDNPRAIDDRLVQAQEVRRVLDRLVGYTVSPLLWRKVAPKLSAGRVQSVAVRLLVMRERERMAFRSGSYWDLKATLSKNGHEFDAGLHAIDGLRVAGSKDFDENTGQIKEGRDVLLLGEERTMGLVRDLTDARFDVRSVERRTETRSPYPPFTTSTLQQEANRKLGFGAKMTMQVAQRLYENGYITYMRTDSVHLSDEAVTASRARIIEKYGDDFLSPKVRTFHSKSKGAQEAHEAIRPAGREMRTVQELPVSGPEARLYDLIWKRTIATQMAEARLAFTSVTLDVRTPAGEIAEFRASGKEVVFPGFFRAYVEGSDDPDEAIDDQSRPLPKIVETEALPCTSLEPKGHETKPPARFTEATLVKSLEKEGIGRPSTYASIIDTIQRRGYVFPRSKQLIPTFTAMAVTRLLEQTHGEVVDVEFTAAMETHLDAIVSGDDTSTYLDTFYRVSLLEGMDRGEELDARSVCTLRYASIEPYEVRVGRYGPFVEIPNPTEGEKPLTVSLPAELAPSDLTKEAIEKLLADAARADEPLGQDPATGLDIKVMVGRFGPYVQLGEGEDGSKPKRVSLPKGLTPAEVTLEVALGLLALPRPLGVNPETQKEIKAGIGQYGPYVVEGRTYASLKKEDDVMTVSLERALELLAEKAKRGSTSNALRELGEHPELGGIVAVMDGRYGPYIKHKRVNATLPDGVTPESVTMEQAVVLISERASKKSTRGATKTAAKKTSATKTAATKTAAKKPAAKKPAAKKPAAKKPAAKKPATKKAAEDGTSTSPSTRKTATKKTAAKSAATETATEPSTPA